MSDRLPLGYHRSTDRTHAGVLARTSGHVPGAVGIEGHRHKRFRLVFFPGETTRSSDHVTVGRIYVVADVATSFEAVGGPAPGAGTRDIEGGHVRGITPPGVYRLAPAEHHATLNWPASSIPWGAKLRVNKGEAEFSESSGRWHLATGPHGAATEAVRRWQVRSGKRPNMAELIPRLRREFIADDGTLKAEVWERNDFGKWAWNLTHHGRRTPYYIHTTPPDELNERDPKNLPLALTQSHGCVHIRPRDRDRMMAAGYLAAGVEVTVMPYGRHGPP